jgi:hypothetical protein
VLVVDANILVAVQDGYVAYLDLYSGHEIAHDSGADLWRDFFIALQDASVTEEQLIAHWGAAEQAGTNEGLARAAELRFGGRWKGIDWIYRAMGFDDLVLTVFGNGYRLSGKSICRTSFDCVNSFFDPRTTWFGSSPVGYFELPVYFFDAFGYALTGH